MIDSETLDAAEFLARSENRVRVLERLAAGSADRTALQEAADTSRVTLGRVLSDFEDRNWVRREGSEYRLTILGETVHEGLTAFLDAVGATHRLRDVIQYLPAAELGVPLRHLHDATVTRPTDALPSKHVHTFVQTARDSEAIRGLWSVLDFEFFRLLRRFAVDGSQDVEGVFGHDVLETVHAEFPGEYLAGLAGSEDGAVYEYSETLPGTVLLIDDVVLLFLISGNGYEGVIESSNETIRAWAEELIEGYREQSSTVDRAWLEADQTPSDAS